MAGAGVLLLWAGVLEAQDSAAVLRGMEDRLDSLRHRATRADSVRIRSGATDTVRVGELRIATSAALRPAVEAAAAEAWGSLSTRFGASMPAADSLPVMQFGGPETDLPRSLDRRELARGLSGPVAQAIWRRQDARLVTWLRGEFPIGPATEEALVAISGELARTPARPNPGCLRGEARACAVALGLEVSGDTLAAWYPQDTWPRLAGLMDASISGRDAWLRDRCTAMQDLASCQTVLSPSRVLQPVGFPGRQLLVELALEEGGEGAFERLTVDSGAPIEHRLSAAAGVPVDTLLSRWVRVVSAAVPGSPAPGGAEVMLSLGWSALVLMMAIRGSRWR